MIYLAKHEKVGVFRREHGLADLRLMTRALGIHDQSKMCTFRKQLRQ